MEASTSYHIFCRGLAGRTVTLPVRGSMNVAELRQMVQGACHVPACEQLLVHAGRSLHDDTATLASCGLTRDASLHLHLRLLGGKGGFGALLRGQGRDGKITDNFDACRDLSGRRIRHVEAEKKMKSWQKDASERELEKVALAHMKQMAKDAKRQKHHQETVEEVKEQQRKAAEEVQEAVTAALAAAGSSDHSSQSAEEEPEAAAAAGAGPKAAAAVGSKRAAGAAAVGSPPKRPRSNMLQMLEDVSDDDGSEEGSEDESS